IHGSPLPDAIGAILRLPMVGWNPIQVVEYDMPTGGEACCSETIDCWVLPNPSGSPPRGRVDQNKGVMGLVVSYFQTSPGRYLRLRMLRIFASLRVDRPVGDFSADLGILAFWR